MRISRVEAIVTCPGRNFALVKIETDTGLTGWGDATLNGREMSVVAYVNEHLAPVLIGEDPLRIEHLWQSLYVGAYWRGGPVQNSALAGVDMALWDILGKEAGQPVYQLLGGRTREGAMCYGHTAATSIERVAEQALARQREGYRAVRIQLERSAGSGYGERPREKPDPPQTPQASDPSNRTLPLLIQGAVPQVGEWEATPYLRSVPKLFEGIRRAVGEELELLHDAHHRLSPIQAAGLARELEPYHPFFFEDPIAPEYAAIGLEQIRKTSSVPIALGEGLFDISTCLPLITGRLIDYLRCDLGHIGGITAARKLAHLAEPFCIKTAWHGPPDLAPLGHAANVHVDVAISNFGIQEWYDHFKSSWAEKIAKVFGQAVTWREGMLNVTDRPGLGMDIDESAARSFPYQRAYLPVVRLPDGSVHPW